MNSPYLFTWVVFWSITSSEIGYSNFHPISVTEDNILYVNITSNYRDFFFHITDQISYVPNKVLRGCVLKNLRYQDWPQCRDHKERAITRNRIIHIKMRKVRV